MSHLPSGLYTLYILFKFLQHTMHNYSIIRHNMFQKILYVNIISQQYDKLEDNN